MQHLSIEERKILEGRYLEGHKFIARDEDTELYSYTNKPEKDIYFWGNAGPPGSFNTIGNSEIYFKFINWKDNEPYEIKKLLEAKNK